MQLAFVAQPGPATAGQAMAPAVQVAARDAGGNVATSFTGTVTLAIAPGTGTSGAELAGTVALAASNGIATFGNLSLDLVGTGYRLRASATGLPSGLSGTFDVFASNAARLEFVAQPSDIVAGATMQPNVQVRAVDAFGNQATGFTGNITVAVTPGSGTSGATLVGTGTRTAAGGVATFDDLTIESAGDGYTLTALTAVGLARRALTEPRSGFTTPALAYGPDWLLELPGVRREEG